MDQHLRDLRVMQQQQRSWTAADICTGTQQQTCHTAAAVDPW